MKWNQTNRNVSNELITRIPNEKLVKNKDLAPIKHGIDSTISLLQVQIKLRLENFFSKVHFFENKTNRTNMPRESIESFKDVLKYR